LLSATRPRSCSLPRVPPQIGFVPQLPAPPRSCCLRHATGPALCHAPSPKLASFRNFQLHPGLAPCGMPTVLLSAARPALKLASFRNFRLHPVLLPAACPRSCSLPRVPPSNWLRFATSGSTRSCSLPHAPGFALYCAPRPKLASFRNFRLHPVLLSATRPRSCSLPCAQRQIGFVSQLPAPARRPPPRNADTAESKTGGVWRVETDLSARRKDGALGTGWSVPSFCGGFDWEGDTVQV
jgi:hypothetical protein